MRNSNKHIRPLGATLAAATTAALFAFTGCGGGGGSTDGTDDPAGGASPSPSSPVPSPSSSTAAPASGGRVSLALAWPARDPAAGRAVPTGANSLRIVTTDAGNGQVLNERVVSRPGSDGAQEARVAIEGLPLRAVRVRFSAHAAGDGTGPAQAVGEIVATLSASAPIHEASVSAALKSEATRLALSTPQTRLPLGKGNPLTATAYNAAGEVVLSRADEFEWSAPEGSGARFISSNFLVGNNVGPLTVTARVRGTDIVSTLDVHLGFPLQVSAGVQGAVGDVPMYADSADDVARALGDGGGTAILPGALLPYTDPRSPVVSTGAPLGLRVPPTYGDRQFVHWVREDGSVYSDSPSASLDPKALGNAFSLSAVYAPRTVANGVYLPNYLDDVTVVRWDTPEPTITFVTAADYTPELKQKAIEGMNWWVRASGGRVRFRFLPDDAPDADITVCFADDPDAAAVHPSNWIPGIGTIGPLPGVYGVAFFFSDSREGIREARGLSRRVIHIYKRQHPHERELMNTAAHELGHALGFEGHSSALTNLMSTHGGGARFPAEADINSILTIQSSGRSRSKPAGTPHPVMIVD